MYTRDITLAMKAARKLEVGNVTVNSSLAIDFQSPFGGKKQSGKGKEIGVYGLREFLEAKTVRVKLAGFK